MHGRIECPECGDVKAGCRCFQHGHIVLWETCDKCKVRLSSQPEEPQYKIKKVESRVVGDTLIHEVWLELRQPLKVILHDFTIKRNPDDPTQ